MIYPLEKAKENDFPKDKKRLGRRNAFYSIGK
jgi:hypothetical protein